jgi:hypothetical protein
MHFAVSGHIMVALAIAPFQHSPPTHAYYPAAAGDRWEYESTVRGRFTNEVLSVDGPISRVRSVDASGRVSHLDVEVRGDSVLLRRDGQNARLLVDFGVALGDSYMGSAGPSAEVVSFQAEHESLELGGLVLQNVREYQHRPESGVGYTSYYARGVGLVGMQWESGISVQLVAAEVGGKSIGSK